MSDASIKTSDFTRHDIRDAVAIHRREISQGFLSSLGGRALEFIFSLAADGKHGVLMVAKDGDGKTIGFLLGATSTGKFYKEFMLKKALVAGFVLLPKLLSFARLRKVLETLLYPSKSELQDLPRAELLDIAVTAEAQGTGVAAALFKALAADLRARGIVEFRITTGESLTRAQRFYEKLGAERVATIEVHQGQNTVVYVYHIPDASASAEAQQKAGSHGP